MGEYGWAIGIGIIILAVSVGRAVRGLGRAFANRSGPVPGHSDSAVSELRAELDETRRRLADLEERVDFSERLLAKQRDAERLARPQT